MKSMRKVLSIILALIMISSTVISVDAAVIDFSWPEKNITATTTAKNKVERVNSAFNFKPDFTRVSQFADGLLNKADGLFRIDTTSLQAKLNNAVLNAKSFINLAATVLDEGKRSGSTKVEYGVSSTYTVTVPMRILATKPDSTLNEYTVKAENVIIPIHTELGVSVIKNGELTLYDNSDITVDYNLYKKNTDDNDIALANGKARILKVPCGVDTEKTATIYATLAGDINYAGLYKEDTVQFVLKVTDTTFTSEEIESQTLMYKIGKTSPEYVLCQFDDEYTTATIFANGEDSDGLMMDFDAESDDNPFYAHRNTLESISFTGTSNFVKSIGNNAFTDCSEIYGELIIPNTIESVGDNAFKNCCGLTSVVFEDGTLLLDTAELEAMKAPASTDSVTDTSEPAKQTKPEQVKSEQKKVESKKYKTEAPKGDSEDEIIGNNGCYIGTSAFENCYNIKNVTFGNTVVSIGERAFKDCTGIPSITTGVNTKVILRGAFFNCSSVAAIDLPSVSTVNCFAFNGITKDVVVNYGAETIRDVNSSPENGVINIKDSVKQIGEYAFVKDSFYASDYADSYSHIIKSLKFEKMPEIIGDRAFSGQTQMVLDSLNLDGCNYLGNRAFQNCSALNCELELGNTLETIGEYAFSKCETLAGDIVIPATCKNIGDCAFEYTGITEVKFADGCTTTLERYVFYDCPDLTKVDINNTEVELGYCSFANLQLKEDLILPNTVNGIDFCAFQHTTVDGTIYLEDAIGDGSNINIDGIYRFDIESAEKLVVRANLVSVNTDYNNEYFGRVITLNCDCPEAIYDIKEAEGIIIDGESKFAYRKLTFTNKVEKIVSSCGIRAYSEINFGDNLEYICDNAFYEPDFGTEYPKDLESLISCANCDIVFPNSLKHIGKNAFRLSGYTERISKTSWKKNPQLVPAEYGFKSITMNGNVEYIGSCAFYNLSQTTGKIKITDKCTEIGSSAFCNCSKLEGTVDCGGLKEIPFNTFYNCSSITKIESTDSLEIIGAFAFQNCSNAVGEIELSDKITEIGESAFEGCSLMTGDIIIPETTEYLGSKAFKNSGIKSVKLADSIEVIPESTFENCTSLTTVQFGENTKEIGKKAFAGCTVLSDDVIITDETGKIGESAFEGCTAITKLYVEAIKPDIEKNAFKGCSGITDLKIGCETITSALVESLGCRTYTNQWSLTILDTARTIEDSAFSDASNVYNLSFENGLVSIGNKAFYNCKNLSGTLNIPDSLESIGNWAFASHAGELGSGYYMNTPSSASFTAFNIGEDSHLKTIGNYAFYGCYKMGGEVNFPATLESIGTLAFAGAYAEYGVWSKPYNGSYITQSPAITAIHFDNSSCIIGDSAFKCCYELKTVDFGDNLLAIGNNAFELTDITGDLVISDTVTSIGVAAFKGLTKITSLDMSNTIESVGTEAFKGCSGINGTLVLSDTLTELGNSAFNGCSEIDAIEAPAAAYSTGTYAFANCSDLKTLDIPTSTNKIAEGLFQNCIGLNGTIEIPANVTAIEAHAFEKCTGIDDITFNEGLVTIGDYSFSDDTSLKHIVIPDSCTAIGNYSFNNCSNSATVKLGEGVKSIGTRAFYHCIGMKGDLVIPDSVEKINTEAFSTSQGSNDEMRLASITFGSGLKTLGDNVFARNTQFKTVVIGDSLESVGTGTFKWCSSLTSYNVPDVMYEQGTYTFAFCNSLKNANVNDTAKEIAEGFFYSCEQLNSAVIPASVEKIGNKCFENCQNLNSPVLNEGLKEIGNEAFMDCYKVRNANFPASLEVIGDKAYCGSYPSYRYYNTMNLVGISFAENSNLKHIGNQAFDCNPYLGEDIIIPDSCEYIGSRAFAKENTDGTEYPCGIYKQGEKKISEELTKYTSEYPGYDVSYFDGYTYNTVKNSDGSTKVFPDAVRNIVISENSHLNYIGEDAFSGRNKANIQITLPETLNTIGEKAFYDCRNLTYLKYNAKVDIPDYCFYNCPNLECEMTFAEGVKEIGKYAFYNCQKVNGDLIFPEGIQVIDDYAFYKCFSVEKLYIPESVQKIGDCAFWGITTGDIDMPSEVATLGENIFGEAVMDEDGATYLGAYLLSFDNIKNLTSYTVRPHTKVINDGAFEGENLQEVILPDSVEIISNNSFKNMAQLTTVNLPTGLKKIGDSAFEGCPILEVDVTDAFTQLTSLGKKAFYNLPGITGVVTIPECLEVVGSSAFENCTGITGVIINKNYPIINSRAFAGCSGIEIIEENGSLKPNIATSETGDIETGKTTVNYTQGEEKTLKFIPKKTAQYKFDVTGMYVLNSKFEDGRYLVELLDEDLNVISSAYPGYSKASSISEISDSNILDIEELGKTTNLPVCEDDNNENTIYNLDIGNQYSPDIKVRGITVRDKATGNVIPEGKGVLYEGEVITVEISDFISSYGNYWQYTINGEIQDSDEEYWSQHNLNFFDSESGKTIPVELTVEEDLQISFYYNPREAYLETSKNSVTSEKIKYSREKVNENYENYLDFNGYMIAGKTYYLKISECPQGYEANDPNYSSSHLVTFNHTPFEPGFTEKLTIDVGVITQKRGKTQKYDALYKNYIANDAFTGVNNVTTLKFACEDISWNTRTVFNYANYSKPWNLILGNGVKVINDYTFETLTNLTGEISFPKSIRTVGKSAFDGCTGIKKITFAEGIKTIGEKAFYGCTGITETLNLPNSLTSLDEYAFSNSTITSLTLGTGLTEISNYSFYMCSQLSGNLTVPSNVKTIGISAFKGTALTNLFLNEGLETIKSDAFVSVPITTDLIIPSTVTEIGIEAFYQTKLHSVKINTDKSVSLGGSSFSDISATDLYIKAKEIDCKDYTAAFDIGDTLENIYIEVEQTEKMGSDRTPMIRGRNVKKVTINCKTVSGYDLYAWCNAWYFSNDWHLIFGDKVENVEGKFSYTGYKYVSSSSYYRVYTANPTKITFGPNIKNIPDELYSANDTESKLKEIVFECNCGMSIGNSAFKNCKLLDEIKFTNGGYFKSIGNEAFEGCSLITDSDIDMSKVIKIGTSAFDGTALKNVVLPVTLTKIGKWALPLTVETLRVNNPDLYLDYCIFKNTPLNLTQLTLATRNITANFIRRVYSDSPNVIQGSVDVCLLNTVETIEDGSFGYASDEILCKNGKETVPGSDIASNDVTTVDIKTNQSSEWKNGIASSKLQYGKECILTGSGNNPGITYFIPNETGYYKMEYAAIEGNTYFCTINNATIITSNTGSKTVYLNAGEKYKIEAGYSRSYSLNLETSVSVSLEKLQCISYKYICPETMKYSFDACIPNEVSGDIRIFNSETGSSVINPNSYWAGNGMRGRGERIILEKGVSYTVEIYGNLNVLEDGTKGKIEVYPVIDNNNGYSALGRNLHSIDIQGKVEKIGNEAFSNCNSLETVKLNSCLKEIGEGAFYSCSGLTEINLAETSLEIIKDDAFGYCENLLCLTLPDSCKTIGNYAFCECCNAEGSVIISNNSSVGNNAYTECYNLDTVKLGNNVTVGTYAFYRCSSLDTVEIGSNVTLPDYVFNGCSSVKNFKSDTNFDATNDWNSEMTKNFGFESTVEKITFGKHITDIGSVYNIQYRKTAWPQLQQIKVDAENTAFMSSTGILYNKAQTEFLWVPAKLTGDIIIPEGITEIPDNLFEQTKITSVALPQSLISVGTSAFANCENLAGNIVLSDNVTSVSPMAFYNDSGIENISFGNHITNIGYQAFYNCTSAESNIVIYPNCNVGYSAFENCSSLTGIDYRSNSYEIQENIFKNCSSATGEITIPESVGIIGNGAFDGCLSLNGLTLGKNVTKIGNAAFRNWSSLEGELIIPDNVSEIGEEAFFDENHTNGVTALHIGTALQKFGNKAFTGHTQLNEITCKSANTKFTSDGTILTSKNGKTLYLASEAVDSVYTIPSTVTTIGAYAFMFNEKITDLTIPSNCQVIKEGAFMLMPNLVGLHINTGLTWIEAYAFAYDANITSEIQLPRTLIYIGAHAFDGCTGIIWIGIPAETQVVGEGAFDGVTNATVDPDNPYITIKNNVISGGNEDFNPPYIGKDCMSDVQYELNTDTRTLIITGSGPMQDWNSPLNSDEDVSPFISLLDSIDTIIIEDGVTSIGSYAFTDIQSLEKFISDGTKPAQSLKTIQIGKDVASIGDGALLGELGIENIEISDENTNLVNENSIIYNAGKTEIYYVSSSLTGEYTAPNTLQSLSAGIFAGTGFTSLEFPEAIHCIPDMAFVGMRELETVKIPGALTLGSMSFGFLPKLKNLTMSVGMPLIADENIESLYDVFGEPTFSGLKLTIAGTGEAPHFDIETAFSGETNEVPFYAMFTAIIPVKEVIISDEVTELGDAMFINYGGGDTIKKLVIGKNLEIISPTTFGGRNSISTLEIDSENTNFVIEDGIMYNKDKTLPYIFTKDGPTNLVLPETVTEIPAMFCAMNNTVRSVRFHENIDEIGPMAFAACMKLKNIEAKNPKMSVGTEAFVDIEATLHSPVDALIKAYCDELTQNGDANITWEALCNHDNTSNIDAVAPTCTSDGYTAGVYCEDCQTYVSGHNLIKGGHKDTDQDGICEVCGESANDIILNVPVTFTDEADFSGMLTEYTFFKYTPKYDGKYSLKSSGLEQGTEDTSDTRTKILILHTDSLDDIQNISERDILVDGGYYGETINSFTLTGGETYYIGASVSATNGNPGEITLELQYKSCEHLTLETLIEGVEPVSCTEPGVYGKVLCKDCNHLVHDCEEWTIPHRDENHDTHCDDCGVLMSAFAINVPTKKTVTFPEDAESEIDAINWYEITVENTGKYSLTVVPDDPNAMVMVAILKADSPEEYFELVEAMDAASEAGDYDLEEELYERYSKMIIGSIEGSDVSMFNLEAGTKYQVGILCLNEDTFASTYDVTVTMKYESCEHTHITPTGTAPTSCSEPGVYDDVWCNDCNDIAHRAGEPWYLPHTDENHDNICDLCNGLISEFKLNKTKSVIAGYDPDDDSLDGYTWYTFATTGAGTYKIDVSAYNKKIYLVVVKSNSKSAFLQQYEQATANDDYESLEQLLVFDDSSWDAISATCELEANTLYQICIMGTEDYDKEYEGFFDVLIQYTGCTHDGVTPTGTPPVSCSEPGVYDSDVFCPVCNTVLHNSGDAWEMAHRDDDNNGKCDDCGAMLGDFAVGEGLQIKVLSGSENRTYYKFIAPETKTYKFYSEGGCDTQCDMYSDEAHENYLTGDDDSGSGYNFAFTCYCEAGHSYYLGIRGYDSGTSTIYIVET